MQRSHNLPLPPRIPIYMRHSQNPPSDPNYTPTLNICDPPRIYPSIPPIIGYSPFLTTICDTSIIHPSFTEYTPFYIKWGSQNLPHLFRIYPPFRQLYAMLPESIPPSQNLARPPKIYTPLKYATLAEYTHPSRIYPLLHHYMRHSHNLPSLP